MCVVINSARTPVRAWSPYRFQTLIGKLLRCTVVHPFTRHSKSSSNLSNKSSSSQLRNAANGQASFCGRGDGGGMTQFAALRFVPDVALGNQETAITAVFFLDSQKPCTTFSKIVFGDFGKGVMKMNKKVFGFSKKDVADISLSNIGVGKMKRLLAILGLLALGLSPPAFATGTAAGTNISNTATATFDVGTTTGIAATPDTVTILVNELVDVTLTNDDGGNVIVQPGNIDQFLTYTVTNTGNGDEVFIVSVAQDAGDNFDVTTLNIWLDGGNATFDNGGGDDVLHTSGNPIPALNSAGASNDSQLIFVEGDIPGAQADGDLANLDLTATSANGTGAAGTVNAGAGDDIGNGPSDIVFGTSTGTATATGTFEVADINLALTKTVAVLAGSDPLGGNQPLPTAILRYTIEVRATGSSIATNVLVVDSTPANTTFVLASITLGGVGQSDAADGDDGDFNITNAGAISVDVTSLGAGVTGTIDCTGTGIGPCAGILVDTITFDVTID